jgi:hypothetical protein
MLGLGKKREFLLKLLCGGLLLFGLSLVSWGLIWVGLVFILVISIALHYNSTRWILKKLDLGPEAHNSDDVHISPIIKALANKYEITKPLIYKTKTPGPLVLGLGSKEASVIAISEPFFNKLTLNEKEALLEIAIHKIETEFCKNIEFVTHLNSLILFIGSKLDLVIAFAIGLKRNKNVETYHYVLFTRFSVFIIRIINYFYMNKKIFSKFDEITYQNNSHLVLALNKTLIYSPLEKKTINPLLCPFNFCNLPRYVSWHKHLEIQPDIETRLFDLQKDKNLMLESLTI